MKSYVAYYYNVMRDQTFVCPFILPDTYHCEWEIWRAAKKVMYNEHGQVGVDCWKQRTDDEDKEEIKKKEGCQAYKVWQVKLGNKRNELQIVSVIADDYIEAINLAVGIVDAPIYAPDVREVVCSDTCVYM